MELSNMHKLPITYIESNGLRRGIKHGNEMRGNDIIYDPWLRIPKNDVKNIVQQTKCQYFSGDIYGTIKIINNGGINHINRELFNDILRKLGSDNSSTFIKLIEENGSNKVKILFYQILAHRLHEWGQAECARKFILYSIKLSKDIPHPSWDKWVASGYFFLARYSDTKEDKIKYCIATILEPREIHTLSAWMLYWKIFRAAAWLVGHRVESSDARKAIERYKKLGFRGYCEVNPSATMKWSTDDIINNPDKCLKLMTNTITHELGDP